MPQTQESSAPFLAPAEKPAEQPHLGHLGRARPPEPQHRPLPSLPVLCACGVSPLCNPKDGSPPGFLCVRGIFQARILEPVAISFSRGSFPTQGWNLIFCTGRPILYLLSHLRSLKEKIKLSFASESNLVSFHWR